MVGELTLLCKAIGSVKVQDEDGNDVVYVYDWANDEARVKSLMTEEELIASEKWRKVKQKNG